MLVDPAGDSNASDPRLGITDFPQTLYCSDDLHLLQDFRLRNRGLEVDRETTLR